MKPVTYIFSAALLGILAGILAVFLLPAGCTGPDIPEQTTAAPTTMPPQPTETTVVTEPPHIWQTGYLAALTPEIACCDEAGNPLGTLIRGTQVEYEIMDDGRILLNLEDGEVFLSEDAAIAAEAAEVIPAHTRYIRTTVNLRDAEGRLLETLAEKGMAGEITGYDYLEPDGQVHMYRLTVNGGEGYILPWYLADSEEEALANYDAGSYAIHAARGNQYGGGGAADLDYYPREKGVIEGNEMPEECRTLYLASWCVRNVDAYLAIAEYSGINAFVVDITDGGSIGYAADVINTHCPTAAAAALNTVEDYQSAIRKLKDAGYYVIGRITTFHDSFFVQDHPESAISDTGGAPLKIAGGYWPSAYDRTTWQYKVDLAVEAVELMGFHEIQFDYVRFPDNTWRYERAGTIDFRNTYGETKAQAIQRFLMYAADILHEHRAYVSADVFGESAYAYVTAYGQYWPAISNVVDAISGMPYPDHFEASGSWLPWEHPYETLYNWGRYAMERQNETETPAVVRTWIQAYNAIREPYNPYGVKEIAAQIKGLRDAGCTGGYMTWNAGSSLGKYTEILSAFAPADGS